MELSVKNRNIFGKKTKSLRKNGFIPAELYGHKISNRHLSVPSKEFAKIYKTSGEQAGLVNLITEDNEKIPVLITNIQTDSLSKEFLNIDFYRVKTGEAIKTKIPIHFLNEAPAVKEGFILIKVLDEIEIETLPQDIPQNFEVDLSPLKELNQSIHVKDLKTKGGVKILNDNEAVIAIITERKEEAAPPSPPAETAPTTPAPTTPIAGIPPSVESPKKS